MGNDPLVIRPSPPWRVVDLKELWEFRDLILLLGNRDIKLRYRQTVLGIAWVVLQPLLGAAVLAFVFGRVAHLNTGGVPYFLFTLTGMVLWGAGASTVTRTSNSLVQNPQLISKIFFPRLALPLSTLYSIGLDLAVGLALVMAVMAVHGFLPSWRFLTLPLWIGLLLMLATGLGLFAAALTVNYRDVQHVLPVMLQVAFYATPVAYPAQAVPMPYRDWMLQLNPVATLLDASRWALFGEGALTGADALSAAVWSGGALLGGAIYFRRAERGFADVI
jgi:homopolymeric O-antigen transport system permease protein